MSLVDDLDSLFNEVVILESITKGKTRVAGNESFYYAEGLGQKIIAHCLSYRYLLNGYQVKTLNQKSTPQIDFPSLAILSRAAAESYLVFSHIFITGKSESEKKFRFDIWDLAGYLERNTLEAESAEHKKIKESEAEAITHLIHNISNTAEFKQIKKDYQEKILQGQWRSGHSWSKLAENSGFKKSTFDHLYKHVCSMAHSSRLSITQTKQITEAKAQLDMAKPTMILCCMTLARYCYDYMKLLEGIGEKFPPAKEFPLIHEWKTISETL